MKALFVYSAMVGLALSACQNQKKINVTPESISTSGNYQPPVFSDENRLDKIKGAFPVVDKIFRDHFDKNHFPGVAFGIVADGQLVYSNAFGVANVALKQPATTRTDFRIASMSKSFTALSILKLRDEGKLSLQDPVSKYIPEMGKVKYLSKDAPPITIDHLLTMSAGFPEDNPWGDRQLADTDRELLELIGQGISFSNAPGIVFEYSNLGFGMLGKIVGIVSGQPYQQYINENILRPLQMNDARWEYSDVPTTQLAVGYRWEDSQWKEEPMLHDGIFGAMGGLICSVEDFSKYILFHMSAWPPRNDDESPILKRSSLREMHQLQRLGGLNVENRNWAGELCPMLSGYGYGLAYRKDCKGLVSVRHGGGLPGFGSEWRFLPELGIGIVALSNLTYGGIGAASARALDTLVYLANLKPRDLPISSMLEQRQKEIVNVLSFWSAENVKIFADNFFLDHSLNDWEKLAAATFTESGKILNVKAIKPENQLRGTFVIECEKKNIEVFFTLTPEQNPLIQQLNLSLKDK